eukprot:TRINITY_DN1021_c0_g1_i2.p1 TRINITY_DN1021_c0_g1~~TRINITY_DN1021_c0_g1_i2.p1  ORF type:complete len:839 (+),score=335.52 TRINITY_DN1021_c0_g1_i2:80-2596(+)
MFGGGVGAKGNGWFNPSGGAPKGAAASQSGSSKGAWGKSAASDSRPSWGPSASPSVPSWKASPSGPKGGADRTPTPSSAKGKGGAQESSWGKGASWGSSKSNADPMADFFSSASSGGGGGGAKGGSSAGGRAPSAFWKKAEESSSGGDSGGWSVPARQHDRDDRRQRAEEIQAETSVRQKELAAAQAVRKVISRLKVAKMDTVDKVREDLDAALAENIEKMGSHAEKVSQEAEKALEDMQKRLDAIAEQKEAQEREKAEAAERAEKQKEELETLAKDVALEIEKLEAQIVVCEEVGKPLKENTTELSGEALLVAITDLEKAVAEGEEMLKPTSASLNDKAAEAKKVDSVWKHLEKDFKALRERMAPCRKSLREIKVLAEGWKKKASRLALDEEKQKVQKAVFKEYDLDGDGHLSEKEVTAFAKGIYEVELTAAMLEHVLKPFRKAPVPFEKLQKLRARIGIEKSVAQARSKAAAEEERRQMIDSRKAELDTLSSEVTKTVTELQTTLRGLTAAKIGEGDGEMTVEALKKACEEAQAALADVDGKIEGLEAEQLEDEELIRHRKAKVSLLRSKAKTTRTGLTKALTAAHDAEGAAVKKSIADTEKSRRTVAQALQEFALTESKTHEELFDVVKGDAAGISKDALAAFVKEKLPECEVASETVETVAKKVAGGEESLSKEQFLKLMQVLYRVSKSTVLTEEFDLKSDSHRRIEEEEVVEVLTAAKKDEKSGLVRLKCKALSDGTLGWITSEGNKGTVFLQPQSNYYIAVKENDMTDELPKTEAKNIKVINPGDVFEIVEHAQKDKTTKTYRAKVKMLAGAQTVGWVTVAGSGGDRFLESC